MKIKLNFNSGDELCLNKKIGIPSKIDLFFSMTDLLLDLFSLKKSKYYPKIFLDECLYKI